MRNAANSAILVFGLALCAVAALATVGMLYLFFSDVYYSLDEPDIVFTTGSWIQAAIETLILVLIGFGGPFLAARGILREMLRARHEATEGGATDA